VPTLYSHVAVVECADAAGLEELLAAGLSRYVVRRLGDTAIVVDHQRLTEVHRLFKRLGQTPRVTTE
jgi:ribosomal protein L13E